MDYKYSELLGYAKKIIIHADGMYLGNLQYWLVKWAREARGKLTVEQYNRVIEDLQGEGYHVLFSTIYKPSSEWYEKKKVKERQN